MIDDNVKIHVFQFYMKKTFSVLSLVCLGLGGSPICVHQQPHITGQLSNLNQSLN